MELINSNKGVLKGYQSRQRQVQKLGLETLKHITENMDVQ